ncbi:TonB-dependent siderophore receptor [Herbaspirillum sp. RV1423]|uniref:TonB-dependent siderophore receptor n=1 Tax=Herbaspirillum sp. RV1423 TaxID=1443993 RepID=UPI0004AD6A4C|nr:TonB-dependent siderophore receptor [Herbaspirillum sp. RV1423]
MLKFSMQALFAASCSGFLACGAAAQTADLPDINVVAEDDEQADQQHYRARHAVSTMKSSASLHETARSVSVVTRKLLDDQQATTMTEALRNVAGVVPGTYGRRGWDDVIIRGQRANESLLVDGLPLSTFWVAQEPFGADRIEVLKGGASVLFGNVQPGGVVNTVSKRPRREFFADIGATYGSDAFRQLTLDAGNAIGDGGKAAWRLNALALDRGDPTRFVYQKHYWIAPSLTLDLGADTDLTFLLSHNYRDYQRQQGVSPYGSILPNSNGKIPDDFFAGEPGASPYHNSQTRLAYVFEHRFSAQWSLMQNFHIIDTDLDGTGIFFAGVLGPSARLQPREARRQHFNVASVAADTALGYRFEAAGRHELRLGWALNAVRDRTVSTTCKVAAIDQFQPVYGARVDCNVPISQDSLTRTLTSGLYAQDHYKVSDALSLQGALRHDSVRTDLQNHVAGTRARQTDSAVSGSAGASYRIGGGFAPYVSYATSFTPATDGSSRDGKPFDPETGRQHEIGLKWLSADEAVSANLAYYDLTRKNVLATDPLDSSYRVQIGEQNSRGIEFETSADIGRWQWSAAYANTLARVLRDTPRTTGKSLDNIPRHSLSVWAAYRFLPGWSIGLGGRAESAKRGYSFNYEIPGYAVADAALTYSAGHYRAALNVKNLADRRYYAGGISNRVLTTGDPRTILLNLEYRF